MLIAIEHGDQVCVLRLSGHFRSGEYLDYVRDKLDEIKSHDCSKMLADLRELQSIGSTGMGFIAGVYVCITKRTGGRFVLVGANLRVREVFDLTRLSSIIPIAEDLPSGMVALRGEGQTADSAGKG